MSSASLSETIPAFNGRTLAESPVNLPADLKGRIGILVLGFSKKSSSQTKEWSESLLKDYGNDANVVYYSGAVLAGVPGMVRGMVIKGIRNDMPLAEREHFIPILQDASKWQAAAHFSGPDEAYILVIDRAGEIEWRAHGPKTREAYNRLKEAVLELQKAAGKKVHSSAY